MSGRDDISLDEVREARPSARPPAGEWLESERGQRVLQRVLAADQAAAARRGARSRRAGGWTAPRLVFAAGAAMVVALAVALAVILTGQEAGTGGQVASTGTSATAAEQVTKLAAVVGLMPLYTDTQPYDRQPSNGDPEVLWARAQASGLVLPNEASSEAAAHPMTNGSYAVLLARAFRPILPEGAFPAQPLDPRASAEERAAIDLLVTSGVILPEEGTFIAGQVLTKNVQDRLLGRVQAIYDLLTRE